MLVLAVTFSRASARLGVPLALGFLLIGVLAGSEGIGGIPFANYQITYQIGIAALVLILFDGGLNISIDAARSVLAPATLLATVGVGLTALATAAAAHLFGLDWPVALLLGAIVSSTDAAAVFSTLSASGTRLRRSVGHLLELESGLNDPMAVILTTALTANLVRPGSATAWMIGRDIVVELTVGAIAGYVIGRLARWRMSKLRLPAAGLYPAYSIGVACLAYGAPALIHGSGFLSVYVAAVILARGSPPSVAAVRRVHDALAWVSQIVMFLILGMLLIPSRLSAVAAVGLAVALVLVFIARPAVVALCLAPLRHPPREILYVGWVGLRGAVPIVLATIPVMSGAPGAHELFDGVFFIVVVGAFLPGATVPWVTRRLGLQAGAAEARASWIARGSGGPTEVRRFVIEPELAVVGATVESLPLPRGAAVILIEREGNQLAVSGTTVLEAGDLAYVLHARDDEPAIELLFGGPLA